MVKKFIFSAVALIGFTVASYGANTVEKVEVHEVVSSSEISIEEFPCTEEWKTNMIFLQSAFNATFEEALVLADRIFYQCLETRYGN